LVIKFQILKDVTITVHIADLDKHNLVKLGYGGFRSIFATSLPKNDTQFKRVSKIIILLCQSQTVTHSLDKNFFLAFCFSRVPSNIICLEKDT